ncbi:SAM-dependent methyltransferase, partial [Streptomyces sp. SID8455]|nr:SAM-dependent methyltransferase [Streptomyces sp. SID8455]
HARAAPPGTARTAAGAAAFLGGRERREPGVVSCPHPHPHPHPHPEPAAAGTLPARLPPYAAVAREP